MTFIRNLFRKIHYTLSVLVLKIHSSNTRGNIADDFVTNRAKLFRHVICRVGVTIQENNFIAKLHVWNIRDVDEHLIHADASDNRCGMAMDEHAPFVGKQTIIDAMLGLSAPSDKAANRLAERKRKDKLNGGIALITGQGNQSQTYIER